AFTPEAFALACRAPEPPAGAGYAEAQTHNGYALRYLRDFSIEHRADASLMSAFVGATTLDSNRYMAFDIGDGTGGSAQDVRIVGSEATVDVAVTGQPIEVTDVGGDDPETAASGSGKATKKKATASK